MILLALEFSCSVRSVALLKPAAGEASLLCQVSDHDAPSRKPLQLVAETLRTAGLDRENVEGIVVGLGPGSYTGVRSAIALAQGWQLARGIRLLGLSSAEGLAAQAHASGLRGHTAVVIDAQRGEIYVATFELDSASWRPVEPLRLATVKEVQSWAATRRSAPPSPLENHSNGGALTIIGPEADRWFSEGRVLIPEARYLGGLAAGRDDFVSGEKLEPIYLRPVSFVKAPRPRALPEA